MKRYSQDTSSWIPKEFFLAYVGETQQRKTYSNFYDKAVLKKNMSAMSFNWGAFLFFPAWLGYRRQWGVFGIYIGIMIVAFSLETLFHVVIPNSAYTGLAIGCGFTAKGLLLHLAHKKYSQLKKEGLADSLIIEKMRDKAKGSVGLAIAFALLFFIAILLQVYFFSFLPNP